jgi:protein-S-isoprenylcysteine O-methyltransferase Ste14
MGAQTGGQTTVQKPKAFQWLTLILIYLFIPVVLFVFGWDLSWWQAWVYSVTVIGFGIGIRLWADKRHPGLMAERFKFEKGEDVKSWDKVLGQLMAIFVGFPLYIMAGLDHRFGWSPAFPLWLNILGLILIALGYAFTGWALLENRFFSSMVRIQKDRGHVVCDTGPYAIIRHPGYAGNILPLAGIVMALSSLWTLIPAAVALILAVIRTTLEDRTLQEELPGYREYAQRVRYRLFPGIW